MSYSSIWADLNGPAVGGEIIVPTGVPVENTGIINVGGIAILTDITGWPTSSTYLAAGQFYAVSGSGGSGVYVTPGFTSITGIIAIMLGSITAATLLRLNAEYFPIIDPVNPNQFWINGGVLCISTN